jgi:flagellar protein FlgJ
MDVMNSVNIPITGDNAAEKARQLQRQGAAATGLSDKQRQQAKKISQDFEGVFIGMMLKAMHDTVGQDKLTGGGRGEEVFRSLLDQEYVAAAVKRGGFGLAKYIEKEIIQQESQRVNPGIDRQE